MFLYREDAQAGIYRRGNKAYHSFTLIRCYNREQERKGGNNSGTNGNFWVTNNP